MPGSMDGLKLAHAVHTAGGHQDHATFRPSDPIRHRKTGQ
jgi:hypothetical protein